MSDNEEKQDKQKANIDTLLRSFVAGGVAGCCAKTTVAPLDRIKILMQAHNKHYKYLGVRTTMIRVFKKEGVLGLYQGNGVQMIRIFPYSAVQFMCFEQYKKLLKEKTVIFNHHPYLINLCSGALAGSTAVLCTYPLDVIRARLAYQLRSEPVYDGLKHAVQLMVQQEGGVQALFRGIVPTLIGMMPYAGLAFFTFEWLKTVCLNYFPDTLGRPCPKNTGGLILIIPAKLLCGGFAGATAQTFVYPIDVARRKMQLYSMLPEPDKYTGGWMKILRTVYREHGIQKGLYRGLSINYIRVIPMVAMSFTTYETMKQLLGLDTGTER